MVQKNWRAVDTTAAGGGKTRGPERRKKKKGKRKKSIIPRVSPNLFWRFVFNPHTQPWDKLLTQSISTKIALQHMRSGVHQGSWCSRLLMSWELPASMHAFRRQSFVHGALILLSISGSHWNFIEQSFEAEMADQLASNPEVPLLMVTNWPLQTWWWGCWTQFVSTVWVTLQRLFFRDKNTLFKPKAVSTYCSNIEAIHINNSHTETWFSILCLHTRSQSACELSSVSKKHDHREHTEKIPLHTKKAKTVIWQWLQQPFSQSPFVMLDMYVLVCTCAWERVHGSPDRQEHTHFSTNRL